MGAMVTSSFGAHYREVEIGEIVMLAKDAPFTLECGETISNFPLAYQTYGTLNAKRNNAILVCHALSGDQYVCDTHPVTGKSGWWDRMVGAGKPIDTDKYFVICSNVIGSCMGSWGPKEINPKTGKAYGLSFPFITIGDMVRALNAVAANVSFTEIQCDKGHDSFLLDVPEFDALLGGFIEGSAALYGI